MQKENKNVVVVSCPPCGERACPRRFLSGVALATKRGAYKAISLMSPSIGPADHFLRKGGRLGFTLIELLVVILIIGILAAVAVPQYRIAVAKSQYATLKNAVQSIVDAQAIYYLANGHYADSVEQLDITPPLDNEEHTAVVWCEKDSSIKGYAKCVHRKAQLQYQVYYPHSETTSWQGKSLCVERTGDINSTGSKVCQQETGNTPNIRDTYIIWEY